MNVHLKRAVPLLVTVILGMVTQLAQAQSELVYPGTLSLKVDLTDAARRIYRMQETIPVTAGRLKLSYPKWIPGEHGPTGPIEGITGLKMQAAGKPIAWRRDLDDMYSVVLEVPEGVNVLNLDFEFLSPVGGGNFGAGISSTPRMVMLEWNQVLFYPAGYPTASIAITPDIKVPPGWKFATALEQQTSGANMARFKTVSVNELIDSPLAAGLHYRRIDLAPSAAPAVFLTLFGDRSQNLDISQTQITHHQALIQQAVALFGSQHYDHYDFLLALSKETNHFGLEHHQSSDDRAQADFFTSPSAYLADPALLAHEYVHSWNGKFRRPAGLVTTDFGAPMKADLLWVYEGLTNYLGEVLAARSGMWNAEQYRDNLAITAANMDHRPGRNWRPLRDTADQAQILYNAPQAWANYRRGTDFYAEGSLLWLDVDTRIRALSGGKKSLDDYLKVFYARDPQFSRTSHDVKPYTVEEVVATLNATEAYDWAGYLKSRTETVSERAPLEGIVRGGWQLTYTDTPTELYKALEKEQKTVNLMYSLGFIASNDTERGREPGEVIDVLWNGPAFAAGMAPGMKIVAVNGEAFDAEELEFALKRAQKDHAPLDILVQNLSYFSTLHLQYTGGPKYPRLIRIANTEDLLTPIASAKKTAVSNIETAAVIPQAH